MMALRSLGLLSILTLMLAQAAWAQVPDVPSSGRKAKTQSEWAPFSDVARWRPSQRSWGGAAVARMAAMVEQKAKESAERIAAETGRPYNEAYRDELFKGIEALAQKKYPVYLTPGERPVMPLDGHHRVGAVRLLIKKHAHFGFKTSSFPFNNYDIKADLRSMTPEQVSVYMHEHNAGYFDAELRKLPVEQRFSALPASFDEIKDSPLRSAVGDFMYNHGIDSVHHSNYIEFYIAEQMEKSPKFSAEMTRINSDPSIADKGKAITDLIAREMFASEHSKQHLAWLLKEFRTGHLQSAQVQVSAGMLKFIRGQAQAAGGDFTAKQVFQFLIDGKDPAPGNPAMSKRITGLAEAARAFTRMNAEILSKNLCR